MVSIRGDRVRQLRTALGINQTELAEKLGINQFQVSRYERGSSNPSVDVLVVMAQILNTTSDYLLGLSSEVKPDGAHEILSRLSPAEMEMVKLMRRYDADVQMRLVELVRLTEEIPPPNDR